MRVLLVPNTRSTEAVAATVRLATWCAGRGLEPVLATADASASGISDFGVEPNELGEPALAVALGGDGTILKAVHLLGDVDTPLLGVKLGKLGFLSGATPDRITEAIDSALAGDVRVERRTTLSAEVMMEGRSVGTYRALNEVVVSRGASGRVIELEVSVSGHSVSRVRADGVVVATATGSTAYALSAGGPIVAPSFGGMIVVPVAPHTLQARTLVTEPADVVEIVMSDPDRSDACVLVDGAVKPCRRALERVIVTRGDHDVALVKLDGRDFYDTVAEEFFGSR